jgi:hypothetical protein
MLIAAGHISYVFIVYGTRSLRALHAPYSLLLLLWLGLPTLVAFLLYYLSFLRAGFLPEPTRRTTLTACSIGLSVLSLYCGLFLTLNTFGS